MPEIVWTPPEDRWTDSALARFAREAGFDPQDYAGLHRWSISDLSGFWSRVWDFLDVIGDKGEVVFQPDDDAWMTGARFFPQARVNLAENFLRQSGDAVVLIEADETGHRAHVTADELRARVAKCADGLRAAGVGQGDRVGAVLPNRAEALVTLLATAAVGGVWTSSSPDFGAAAILDRIGQVEPKVLFAAPRITYGGKAVDVSDRIGEVADQMPGLVQLVLVGDNTTQAQVPTVPWEDFGQETELTFTRVPFDAPLYVMYTSGTTGKPKAIVHKTGGVLLTMMKEHVLHVDVRPGDRVLWYSNTAWMMYHWLMTGLAVGATVVLYDGAPVVKRDGALDGTMLWQLVQDERLTHLGISPKYLSTLSDMGFVPRDHYDLSSLRWLMASGSPMAPYQYDWMYDAIGTHFGFFSISGGTDLMGCFLIGAPMLPVRRGALMAKALGMAVQVLDDRGVAVLGRPGELCCTEPFPSMPLTFWGADGDARYHKAYFEDRTLNPGGVRIGTADIYNVCERLPQVADCLAFGRPNPGDEEIVLCLQMAEGAAMTPELAKEIRTRLRQECSPRHVPAAIYTVGAVPYTISGKRVEGAAKSTALGQEVRNKASLANPESLADYADLSTREAF
jgi:acetoacetyl-CoA synthetase